jgi:type IV pilus assembly protein PilM
MEAEDLKNAARYEIERFSPFGIDAAVTDYQVLLKDPAAKKNMVLLAAAKADVVKNYINIISQAGFTVKAVDVNAAALTNAFLNAYPSRGNDPAQEAFILLNIGETASNMSIVHTAVPLVLRDIGIAGKEISEAISKSLDVDLREAYRLKHDPPGDKKEQIAEAARPVLSKLFKEIRLSIGYFENQFSKGISTIYLSGGSARFFGLSEFLNQSLEIQVELWNPFNSATTGAAVSVKALDAAKEELAIAFGLAIRDD